MLSIASISSFIFTIRFWMNMSAIKNEIPTLVDRIENGTTHTLRITRHLCWIQRNPPCDLVIISCSIAWIYFTVSGKESISVLNAKSKWDVVTCCAADSTLFVVRNAHEIGYLKGCEKRNCLIGAYDVCWCQGNGQQ